MATGLITVTKTALLVKNTKGSEKKWSEMLTMNRRHDLQLSLDIDKYNNEFKRTYNLSQRQRNQTARTWASKREAWHQDDFIFRKDFLKQLKPMTKYFKHIHYSSSREDDEDESSDDEILNDDEVEVLSLKRSSTKELPLFKQIRSRSNIRHSQDFSNEQPRRPKTVLSKLVCPKILRPYKPRLDNHHHVPFLDTAQRFLKSKPELIEKGVAYHEKQKQQKKYVKHLIETDRERTQSAAIKFGQQLLNENNSDDCS